MNDSLIAPFEMTEGLRRLKDIIASRPIESEHWNEAQNRFQFVDRLLSECLGWERPSIRVEVSDEAGGRADYIFGSPAKAILEAKKEAKHFDVLPTGKPSAVRKIAPLLESSKTFREVVVQVLNYYVINAAPVAVVCNGPQLAIFQALTPGQPPLEGECFFFNGLKEYIENFPLLWSLLSPEGISENRASRDLALHRNPRIPAKAAEFIPEPRRFRYRSDFQENLRELALYLLEDIEDDPDLQREFYADCYVPLEANSRHLLLSKRIIENKYRRVAGDGVAPTAFGNVAHTSKDGKVAIDDVAIKRSGGSRPIVVIGDVGVGKTSFFQKLHQQLNKKEEENTYFIYVDLGTKGNLSKDVRSYMLSQIPMALKNQYKVDIDNADFVKSVYHHELMEFEQSVLGELRKFDQPGFLLKRVEFLNQIVIKRDTHLLASIGHLTKGRNKQIVLVMDNADQRSSAIQEEAFLIAQELAATRNILVFIALRPSTFYRSKSSGALSGYQHKVLTISPPPADEVIERRLTFALRIAEGTVAPSALEGIRLKLDSIVLFLQATLRSVRDNSAIKFFLSNVTGGNTRAVIELVTSFFGSPNVDSEKIVEIEGDEGDYKVPLHEFTKHALLGEYSYFNSNSSLVACNIFDVTSADPREHFLSPLIIAFLTSNLGVRDSDGFISGEAIVFEMAKNGFIHEQVERTLIILAAKKMIETPFSHYRETPVTDGVSPTSFHYRATSAGVYHIRFWAGSFAFLDATSTDTPIFDETTRDQVGKIAASFEINDRYKKTVSFRNYLEIQWNLANFVATYFDFTGLLKQEDQSFISVRNALDRRYPSKIRKRRGR